MVKQDSLLMEDEIIKDFLKDPAQDFYKEAKMKTAYALRNINFDTETLSSIMADLREIKTKNEVDLLKKAVAISVVGQIEVMKAMHPEMSEREIQGIHEFVYRKYGAADEGYPSLGGWRVLAKPFHSSTPDLIRFSGSRAYPASGVVQDPSLRCIK